MKKLGILLVFGILLACNENNIGNGLRDLESDGLGRVFSPSPDAETYKLEETIVERDDMNPSPIVQEQKIIKTANLTFETKIIEKTHQKIVSLARQYSGFIQNDNSGKDYGREYIQMTVRVPSEKFQPFLEGISEGVSYFDQKQISQKDVTEEFVDINARLKAKRKLENRYLELLQKAKNVKEMLEIERNLSIIREEIEAKEGRLKFLQNKVSLSTFYIEFYKTSEVKSETISYGQKINNALKGGWNGISVFFLGILYLWPFISLLFISLFLIRRYLKKRKNK
ncbi:MAG: DUF4349 domain-containing protein [Flavobacteriaceae bacterium]|nr:DUF4349 domain-containing protein [Flavobacteriaceae bacterium]